MDLPAQHHRRSVSSRGRHDVDDWEDWEDEDVVTPIQDDEQILIHDQQTTASKHPPSYHARSLVPPSSKISRTSTSKIKRLKSKQRQKAQNAKAGIKLITDMTAFGRQPRAAHQMRTPDGRPIKFVDAAALRALEGEPNSASVGNWGWLRRGITQSPASATPKSANAAEQQMSPEDRPIVIGIALPPGDAASRELSPQTATVDTPHPQGVASERNNNIPTVSVTESSSDSRQPGQHHSVWSPDTPDTASSFSPSRTASSVYSQATTTRTHGHEDIPPVPALPTTFKKTPQQKLISLELGGNADDSDGGTPCTLFEEDGIPSPQKQARAKAAALSSIDTRGKASAPTPDSASSRAHGWWDHVVTPFVDKRLTFSSRKQRLASPTEDAAEPACHSATSDDIPPTPPPKPTPRLVQAPIVRAPTPRRTPPLKSSSEPAIQPQPAQLRRSNSSLSGSTLGEKPRIVVTDAVAENPPPYSPPKRTNGFPVRYRAVFPPGHPLQAQFPPSPGPASPGLAATMTSQGATQMSEIPLAPPPRSNTPTSQYPLPTRPVGTRLPQEHAHEAAGRVNAVERERRRHEKEDVVARRFGGLWRGRACIPTSGCFGRTGREGRKRRRVWMAVWCGVIALIILIITLAVVLSRPHEHQPMDSIWVNLTDFPPMPTGKLTVVGPDNTEDRSICTSPSTVWSCSLPKEQHDSVAPYHPNQPTVIMDIQWDNSTSPSWDVPNGDAPASVSRRAPGSSTQARNWARGTRDIDGFKPVPDPPDYKEMWFVGETTDDIQSDHKAGEPTPFFISLLRSLNDTVATPDLTRRKLFARNSTEVGGLPLEDILPQPDLLDDGTPAPAVMMPEPKQQPVRLYDRGLPTEHYGFYTHFTRTIFVKSVTVLNDTNGDDVPIDEDGGCTKTEADYLVNWGQTRLLVQIWTRLLDNTTALLDPDTGNGIGGSAELIRPGTMPWPVTVSMDTHGGDPDKKVTWEWPLDDRQHLDTKRPKLLENTMSAGGTWINHRGSGDDKYGGFDGGTGGCRCEWVNWS